MATETVRLPLQGTMAGFRRFSVAEYHKLMQLDILTEDDNLELLEGDLVHKVSRNPPHDATIQKAAKRFYRVLPSGWDLRVQCAVTLTESEPDLAVVRGDESAYVTRHPGPRDIGVVIEVADSTLDGDRTDKGRIYARAGIPFYGILNLVARQVEVYTAPSGPAAAPAFTRRDDYRPGDQIPVELDGLVIASLAVSELLA